MAEEPRDEALWLLNQIVSLMAEARAAGWRVHSLHTGDFAGSTTIQLTVWRRPEPELDAGEAEPDAPAAAAQPRTETGADLSPGNTSNPDEVS